MSVPSRYLLTAALGLGLIQALPGQEPGKLGVASGQAVQPQAAPSANQRLADSIAEQLRHSALLQGYKIDVSVTGATVKLTGDLSSQAQHDEAIRIVSGAPGLERITDSMSLGAMLDQGAAHLEGMGVRYLEVLIDGANAERVAEAMAARFLPSAYFPAMRWDAAGKSARDYVVLSRSLAVLDFRGLVLQPAYADYLKEYFRLWREQNVGKVLPGA